ncbi:MAG: GntR family transcriptional regulator [Phycisphaerae bacterium]|nr:GntR family transcriptional regulator [Phycisphaerae bacterium]
MTAGSSTPIYRQIIDEIRHGVAGGRLRPGDVLPSIRALAEQLVINPNTVAKAYNELVRDGVIEARQGRGYFVADRRQVYSDAERNRRLDEALRSFLSEALVLDFSVDEIRSTIDRGLAGLQPKGPKRGKSDG